MSIKPRPQPHYSQYCYHNNKIPLQAPADEKLQYSHLVRTNITVNGEEQRMSIDKPVVSPFYNKLEGINDLNQ